MSLPDFSEFLASVDIDEVAAQYNSLNEFRIIQFEANDTKSIAAVANMLYQKAVSDAAQISMMTLQRSHEWLQKELD